MKLRIACSSSGVRQRPKVAQTVASVGPYALIIRRPWLHCSAVPASEQCGWVKDKYGLSWQIVPAAMEQMLEDKDQDRVDRVTQAVMQMKKLDLTALQHAYDGK